MTMNVKGGEGKRNSLEIKQIEKRPSVRVVLFFQRHQINQVIDI